MYIMYWTLEAMLSMCSFHYYSLSALNSLGGNITRGHNDSCVVSALLGLPASQIIYWSLILVPLEQMKHVISKCYCSFASSVAFESYQV